MSNHASIKSHSYFHQFERATYKMHFLPLLAGLSLSGLAYASSSSSARASATLDSSIATSSGTLAISNGASCACAKFAHSLPNRTIFPGSKNYTMETVDKLWDIRADLSPACVVVPETANEVSQAVKIIGSCNAQFAVRGGGHMNVSSSSSSSQGKN